MTTNQIQLQLPIYSSPQHAKITRPLPNRWSQGRGYAVIVVLAPWVLGSLLWIHLHYKAQTFALLLQLRSNPSNPK